MRNRSGDAIELSFHNQLYFLPKTIKQTLEFKEKYPQAVLVNGSTDIAVRQNKTSEFQPQIIDISAVKEIKQIITNDNDFQIGAGCNIENFKIFIHENFHEFSPITDHFASLQIRNIATLGGNICNASPIGDLIPLLIVLKAQVKTASSVNTRIINIENFITGYRSIDLHNNELVTEIIIPKKDNDSHYYSEKVSTRRDLDISTLSIAASIKLSSAGNVEDIMLVYGGLASTVKRAKLCEDFLKGKRFTLEMISEAIQLINNDFTPISDARSTTEYRIEAAGNLMLKLFYSVQLNNNNGF